MSRQKKILEWSVDTYGESAARLDERSLRFLEEALELTHALGVELAMVHRIADRVYEGEAGMIFKELGQSELTLEALAECHGTDLDEAADAEMARIANLPKEHFEKRHAAKVARGIAT